ncbi:hypothetical protein BGX31_007644 [Mortierella sp. GBA43]|nr:hypothetical protein BGX31_007644 [Mortierella sp. GBA43]
MVLVSLVGHTPLGRFDTRGHHDETLDTGILDDFKYRYRQLLLQNALDREKEGLEDTKEVDQLQVMQWCMDAWGSMIADHIAKCFRQTTLLECNSASKPTEDCGIAAEVADSKDNTPEGETDRRPIYSDQKMIESLRVVTTLYDSSTRESNVQVLEALRKDMDMIKDKSASKLKQTTLDAYLIPQ